MNIGKNKIKIEKEPKPYYYIQHAKLPILVLTHNTTPTTHRIKRYTKIKSYGAKTPEHTPTLQSRNKTNSYRLPLNTNPIHSKPEIY